MRHWPTSKLPFSFIRRTRQFTVIKPSLSQGLESLTKPVRLIRRALSCPVTLSLNDLPVVSWVFEITSVGTALRADSRLTPSSRVHWSCDVTGTVHLPHGPYFDVPLFEAEPGKRLLPSVWGCRLIGSFVVLRRLSVSQRIRLQVAWWLNTFWRVVVGNGRSPS
jgi:hypothetical protein